LGRSAGATRRMHNSPGADRFRLGPNAFRSAADTVRERWASGDADLVRKYAAELVALAPDVILAAGSPSVAALQRVTRPCQLCSCGSVVAWSIAWRGRAGTLPGLCSSNIVLAENG
jgi:hypothetical protein